MCFQSDSIKTSRELFQTDVLACGCLWRYKVRTFVRCILFLHVDFSERREIADIRAKDQLVRNNFVSEEHFDYSVNFLYSKGNNRGGLSHRFSQFFEKIWKNWARVERL